MGVRAALMDGVSALFSYFEFNANLCDLRSSTRLMHYTQSARISCFENDATITYPNRREYLVLKMTRWSHTQIGANFLFWKWRHYHIPESAQISCFENDATFTYMNRCEFPVLKMTPRSHTQIGANFLFWKWRLYHIHVLRLWALKILSYSTYIRIQYEKKRN